MCMLVLTVVLPLVINLMMLMIIKLTLVLLLLHLLLYSMMIVNDDVYQPVVVDVATVKDIDHADIVAPINA